MNLKQFSYSLPKSRIAQTPTKPRDKCRLMTIDLKRDLVSHTIFTDLPSLLQKGDVLIFNDSKVIPARLFAKKETGGKVEILLVRKISGNQWTALLKNISSKDTGKILISGKDRLCSIVKHNDDGTWLLTFSLTGKKLEEFISKHGTTPLPPYITKSSKRDDYQTVFAKHKGSVAAPTAGLHFTKRILDQLKKKRIEMHWITLHVGPGTFLPIRTDKIEEHHMLAEYATVSKKTAKAINEAKKQRRRIIAVGTTAVRTLEALAENNGVLRGGSRDVNLFIYPGYKFKIIDGLITNFHLPHSTLIVLVCAFAEWRTKGGMKQILNNYRTAVRRKYRFYSFGDAMIIT